MRRMPFRILTFRNEDDEAFRDAFERACSHIPSGVAILTGTDSTEGPFGLTVSSVTFVSREPAMVSVNLARASKRLELIRRNRRFALNLLREGQERVAALFAAPRGDRFTNVRWHGEEGGAPVLEECLGTLLCELRNDVEAGDHLVLIAEVLRLALRGGEPLVYWRKAFHRLRVEYPFLENEAALEDFIGRWGMGRLLKSEWTHGAHVGTAAYFAFDLDREELFARMRSGITYHNECVGTANTVDSGYHETLTRFWAKTVGEFVHKGNFSTRFEAVKAATQVFGEDRDRHRLYYGFDVVRDRKARREWIKPDREPPLSPSGS